ncbi:LOW QUALITY PROTEIN: hypoxia up-regulated protein 1 [Phoenicopterus ruber ruber]
MARVPCWALAWLLLSCCLPGAESVAVMSVDVGSESMKIAIVKPGVPMEIVLNKESRRKTPVAVSLKENERLFGDSALGMSIRNPKVAFRYFQDLLGKRVEPHVALYRSRFPEHELVKDEKRQTVIFKLSQTIQYSPEEMLGMVLNYSRLAEEFAEQPIKDAVITVPAYFNQAERRAVLHAARMADLKVLQLINDNTAVALNYGVFRRKDINATAQHIMFYDMGAGSTVCTIVTYQTVKTKDSGTQPQLQIQGIGFDRTLGGLEMELRLRDYLAKLFNDQHRSKEVRKNPRAMAKLLKEANRLKTVLSANADHMAQIEGLLDDIDFKAKVSRQEFEDLCSDLFQRVPGPVQQALSSAEMNLDGIDQVILVGGATRVPKVQEVLLKAVGKEELGKNINADEAAAMGAVYQAAALSKAFKVKPFVVRDAAVFPIQVEFTREVEEDDKSRSLKHNKRILFQRMALPQRKVITFNRYTDVEFYVNYGDLSFFSQDDLRIFGSLNLTTVRLKGVGDSFKKHSDYESKGITHFNMDESGVLRLDRVESVFETLVEEKLEEESTLTKLGTTISSLFGGGGPTPETGENLTDSVQEEEESLAETGKEEQGEKQDQKSSAEDAGEEQGEEKQQSPGQAETAPPKAESQQKEEGEKSESQDPKENRETAKDEEPSKSSTVTKTEEEKKIKAPKKQKLVHEITMELDVNDVPDLLEDELKTSMKKLQDLTVRDLEKQEREKSANSLESFIFETQDKLYQEEYQFVSTEEQREEISRKLSEASSWMEEEGYAAATKELKDKLSELKKLCRNLFFRVEERRKWPERLAALESLLNHSTIFLKGARMIPESDQIFTEVELGTLETINETTIWKNETLAEPATSSLPTETVLLSKDIELKIAALDRDVQYLLKAKFAKPKPKTEKNTTNDSGKNATATSDENTIPPTEGKQEDKPEDIGPAKEPPTAEKAAIDEEPGSDSGSKKEKKTEAGGESRKNDEL